MVGSGRGFKVESGKDERMEEERKDGGHERGLN